MNDDQSLVAAVLIVTYNGENLSLTEDTHQPPEAVLGRC